MSKRWIKIVFLIALPGVLYLVIAYQLSWRPRTLGRGKGPVVWLQFSPDDKTLVSADGDNVTLWRVDRDQLPRTLKHPTWMKAVAFSLDGKVIISASAVESKMRVRIPLVKQWDVETGRLLHIATCFGASVGSTFKLSPSAKMLATTGIRSSNYSTDLWDTQTGKLLRSFKKSGFTPHGIDFSANGKILVTSGTNLVDGRMVGEVYLWDIRTGKPLQKLTVGKERDNPIFCVAISPNGRIVAGAGFHDVVWLWDVRTGQVLHTLNGHSDLVRLLSFSPDGELLVTGSLDKTVKLWDVQMGKPRRTLRVYAGADSAAFSRDGSTLAIGSTDVKLWRIK